MVSHLVARNTPTRAYVDATCSIAKNNTPLMFAVMKKDVESIRLLRKAGASLTVTNDDGYNASDMAATTYDRVVMRALTPDKEVLDFARLTDMVVSLLLFIVSWVNHADNGGRRPDVRAEP